MKYDDGNSKLIRKKKWYQVTPKRKIVEAIMCWECGSLNSEESCPAARRVMDQLWLTDPRMKYCNNGWRK